MAQRSSVRRSARERYSRSPAKLTSASSQIAAVMESHWAMARDASRTAKILRDGNPVRMLDPGVPRPFRRHHAAHANYRSWAPGTVVPFGHECSWAASRLPAAGTRVSLERTDDFGGYPTTVEASWLRLHALATDRALETRRVEREMSGELSKRRTRFRVSPDGALDRTIFQG